MAFTQNLQQSLQLPLQNAAAAGASAVGNAINSVTAQATSALNKASPAQLVAEAANKLKQSGMAAGFTNVDKNVGIVKQNGTIMATNASTGKALAPLGAVATEGVPAGIPASAGDRTMEFKVQISSEPSFIGAGDFLNNITLNVMPTISEARSATYDAFSPLHHPGEILKYKNTSARTWTINARLITRTVEEATLNRKIINTLRSWVMPFFGEGTNQSNVKQYLGAPPPILTLAAYGERMIGPVKCVLENYSWEWPNDCDYLPTDEGIPFPVIINLSLSLKESWSPAEYSGFNIVEYRIGNLPQAFSKIKASDIPNSTAQQATPQTGNASRTDISEPQTAGQRDVNSSVPGQVTNQDDPKHIGRGDR
jgi:hypothetical protein